MRHLPLSTCASAALLAIAATLLPSLSANAADGGPRRPILPAEALRRAASERAPHGKNLVTLAFPGATATYGLAVNNRGDVVGQWNDTQFLSHGFLYSEGKITSIDYPGAFSTIVSGINDNGAIVGAFNDEAGNLHGFVLNRGRYAILDYPGATYTQPFGINDAGDVVGFYVIGRGPNNGFLWRRGSFTTMNVPGAAETFPVAINNRGEIVCNSSAAKGLQAYLLTPNR